MTRRSLISVSALVLVVVPALAAGGCGSSKRASTVPTATVSAKPAKFVLPTSAVRFGNYQVVPLLGRSAHDTQGLRRRTR